MEKNNSPSINVEQMIHTLRFRKEFEGLEFYCEVEDYHQDMYQVKLGLIDKNVWVFKNMMVCKYEQIEYTKLHMRHQLLIDICAYGIGSAKLDIKKRKNVPQWEID